MSNVIISKERFEALEAVAAAANELKTRGNGIETLDRALNALTAVKAREANPMGLPWRLGTDPGTVGWIYNCDGQVVLECPSVAIADFILALINATPRTFAEDALIDALDRYILKHEPTSWGESFMPVVKAAEAVRAERKGKA